MHSFPDLAHRCTEAKEKGHRKPTKQVRAISLLVQLVVIDSA